MEQESFQKCTEKGQEAMGMFAAKEIPVGLNKNNHKGGAALGRVSGKWLVLHPWFSLGEDPEHPPWPQR